MWKIFNWVNRQQHHLKRKEFQCLISKERAMRANKIWRKEQERSGGSQGQRAKQLELQDIQLRLGFLSFLSTMQILKTTKMDKVH